MYVYCQFIFPPNPTFIPLTQVLTFLGVWWIWAH